jgi:predicted transglutaminase-like cysteine proteinase
MLWFNRTFFNWFKPVINAFLQKRWNNNWTQAKIFWQTDTNKPQKIDVKETLKCKNPLITERIQKKVNEIIKDCKNDDEKIFEIFLWVTKNIKYVDDKKGYNQIDYWASPDETFINEYGDCEDMGLLINKMGELAGIPAFRRKIVVGNTIYGYHAYFIYLRELFNEWFVLDSALNSIVSEKSWHANIAHKYETRTYLTIDFTFNEVYGWAQRDLLLKPNFEVMEEK